MQSSTPSILHNLIDNDVTTGFIIVVGPPGAGKTILLNKLMYDRLSMGKKVVYMCTSNSPRRIINRMAVFGWDVVPYLEDGMLRFVDSYSGLTIKYEKKDKMPELMKYIVPDPWDSNLSGSILGKALNEIDADRLVIDTLTSLVHRFGDEAATKFITVFSTKIKAKGIGISTLTSGGQSNIFENYMKSISDGIIELRLEDSHLGLDRYLRVYQMKESTHDSKWHQFILNEDGVAFMQDPANRLPKAL